MARSRAVCRILLTGLAGAGKGTQSHYLADEFDLERISLGDVLRRGVETRTDLGGRVHHVVGATVALLSPREAVRLIVEEVQRTRSADRFVLDGGIASRASAEILQRLLPIGLALSMEISPRVGRERLQDRSTCPRCGRSFSSRGAADAGGRACPIDGTPLRRRFADGAFVQRTRFALFRNETEIKAFYRERGLLETVDAERPPGEVSQDLAKAVRAHFRL